PVLRLCASESVVSCVPRRWSESAADVTSRYVNHTVPMIAAGEALCVEERMRLRIARPSGAPARLDQDADGQVRARGGEPPSKALPKRLRARGRPLPSRSGWSGPRPGPARSD